MDTKKEIKYFSIFEHEKEQNYLRDMHKAGWKFVRISGFGVYHFEKCTPEDIVYQLDYNREGLEHKDEYVQMFSDCGWEYLQDYMGYSYFRKPVSEADGEEEIFCDDESRLQMMDRVFKGRLLPLLVAFFVFLLPQFIINMSAQRYLISAIVGAVVAMYIAIFVTFAVQYSRYKSNIKK